LAKTEENIESNLDPKHGREYLQDLLLNIKEAYAKQESLTFRIVKPKEKGFTVKVGGLFAFVSYHHLGWTYPTIEYWQNVSNHLVGNFFTGKIYHVSENPISIQIDAKEQTFEKPTLAKHGKYQGVILKKSTYGAFVDLGFHFNWKFGSLMGLIHKSTLTNLSDFDNWMVGNNITTHFQGFNEKGQLVLGDNRERGKWTNGEMDELVGTIQAVNVAINEHDQTEFYVLGNHKGKVPIRKEFYPNSRAAARKYVSELKDGDMISCEVINISKRKDCFILKLLIF
jgi:ribosomal protein S1